MYVIPSNKKRCEVLALYLIEKQSTVRKVANHFGISKSTVHKDVTQTLRKVNIDLYRQVQNILDTNKRERHIRGGEATKQKFIRIKKDKIIY